MKYFYRILIIFILADLFCSCQSTRVYIKENEQFFEDDTLVEQKATVTKYDYKDEDCQNFQKKKVISEITKHNYNVADTFNIVARDSQKDTLHLFWVESERNNKSQVENMDVKLLEVDVQNENITNCKVVGSKKVTFKKGKKIKSKGKKFKAKDEELFNKVVGIITERINQKPTDAEESVSDIQTSGRKSFSERIQVNSTPDGKYIFYTILGKPFVIAGSATLNVLKCAGYACINFFGGYNAVTSPEDELLWLIPDVKKSTEIAKEAKEANKIKYYPEYHLPFTNNHIIVDRYAMAVDVEALDSEGRENIQVAEHSEYDNTMSVKRSAKADASSTLATSNVIGNIVTIPVSATTWLGGAIFGIASQMQN